LLSFADRKKQKPKKKKKQAQKKSEKDKNVCGRKSKASVTKKKTCIRTGPDKARSCCETFLLRTLHRNAKPFMHVFLDDLAHATSITHNSREFLA
jgi:hypothetical protein